ncbi:MAG: prohead protease/major capsid protein fusion protein [Methylobacter sp.]
MPTKSANQTINQATRQRVNGVVTRAVDTSLEAIDQETRTLTVSFSSEQPYLRQSWWDDPWYETLGHKPNEVDLERLNSAAPVLYNHRRDANEFRIGVVEKAWIEKGKGYAQIRLSQRDEVEGYWQDIQDGILTNISVGYQINERTLTTAQKDAPDEYRVTSWTPLEISFVDIPADYTVGVGRNFEIINLNEATRMDENENQPADNKPAAPDAESIRKSAQQDFERKEKERRTAIRTALAPFADRHPEVMQKALDDMSITPEQASAMMLKAAGEKLAPIAETRAVVITDERDTFIKASVDAVVARSGRGRIEGANPWRGFSLRELARECLVRAGVETRGLTAMDMVGRAFTQSTSDFPVLLENAMHKVLLDAYRTAPNTWKRFCKVGSVSDFRANPRYRTGSFGNLDSLNELGEFKNKSIPDGEKASITAGTKGNIINISRQAIINDDLGVFLGLAADLSKAAMRTIEADVYALVASNPLLGDGVALFDNAHGNLAGTSAIPSVTSLEAARVAMAKQKDVSGNDYLDLTPAIWLGGMTWGGTARVINDSQYDPDTANKLQRPNLVRGLFTDVVDSARITGNEWYTIADPNEAPALEVAFLDGEQEPFLDVQQGFNVDGAAYKVRLDYGVAAIDYRGIYKNAGASS